MNISNLLVRIFAAGLPLAVVALIAGAAGYVSEQTETKPIPPLQVEADAPEGVVGSATSFSGDELTIVTEDGREITFRLGADAPVEMLRPIELSELSLGDWINGGAIPHAQTTLALVGLVLIEEPVVETP